MRDYDLELLPLNAEALYMFQKVGPLFGIAENGTAWVDFGSGNESWAVTWPVDGPMTEKRQPGTTSRSYLTSSGNYMERRERVIDQVHHFLVRGIFEQELYRGTGWLFEDGTAVYRNLFNEWVRDRSGTMTRLRLPNSHCKLVSTSAAGHLVCVEYEADKPVELHMGFDWGDQWVQLPKPSSPALNFVSEGGVLLTELEGEGDVLLHVTPTGISKSQPLPEGTYWDLTDSEEALGVGNFLVTDGKVERIVPHVSGAEGWSQFSVSRLSSSGMMVGSGYFAQAFRPFRLRPRFTFKRATWHQPPQCSFQFTDEGPVCLIRSPRIRLPGGEVMALPTLELSPGRPLPVEVLGQLGALGKRGLSELIDDLAERNKHPAARQLLGELASAYRAPKNRRHTTD